MKVRSYEAQPGQSGLYHAFWRWHFYAALFVAPFLLVFAITGSIYLFKPQIESWLYRDFMNVPPAAQVLSPDKQVQAALAHFPHATVEAYRPPAGEGKSAQVRVMTTDYQEKTLLVNPHTGRILGVIDEQSRPLKIIRELHGKLLSGKAGQMVQELAASWAMILIMTGLYLWWPKHGLRIKGTFLPRFKTSGRVFWRDMHTVTGFWISSLLLFLILTGLPWSAVSGDLIHNLAGQIGRGSPDTGLAWNGGGSQTVKSKLTDEDWATTHAQQLAGSVASAVPLPVHHSPLSLEQALTIAWTQLGIHESFEMRLPVDQQGVFTVVTDHEQNPEKIAYIHLDQYSGHIIKDVRWKDFGPLAQAISMGVVLHEGQAFGLANQLLGLVACLGLIVMIGAGLAMWWHRRPAGKLAAPAVAHDFRLPPSVIATLVILALFMPLMGASLLVILGGEWLINTVLSSRKRELHAS